MTEVKRFTLRWDAQAKAPVCEPAFTEDKTVRVREDRATETERDAVALRLAEWCGDGDDYRTGAGGARKDFNAGADELLSLVFGEEASRG